MMSESTGALLKQAREQRQLTVQQVAEKTKIRSHYVQSLENDDFGVMPSSAQARGFLRIYADFLGLDVKQLIAAAPAVAPAASALPSASVPAGAERDAAPNPKISTPGPFSFLRDLWPRLVPGNRPGAPHTDADAGQATAGLSSEPLDREPNSQALPDEADSVKKKRMN